MSSPFLASLQLDAINRGTEVLGRTYIRSVLEATERWKNSAGMERVLCLLFLRWKQHRSESFCSYWFSLASLRNTCSQRYGVWFYVAKLLSKDVTGFSRQKFNYWDFDITFYFLRVILRSGIIPAFPQYPFFSSLFFFLSTDGITRVYFAFFFCFFSHSTYFFPHLLISFLSLHALCSFICPLLSLPCKLSHFYINRSATNSPQF